MKTYIFATAAALTLSACAQGPDSVKPSYVSPSVFEGRSCSQLVAERNGIVRNVETLTASQRKNAQDDAVITGVTLVLFWPAALLLATTPDDAPQLAQAKGSYDAITATMTAKGC